MRRYRMLALGASLLALISACGTGGGSTNPPASAPASQAPTSQAPASQAGGARTIKIGSADFNESAVMAELYAQVLEANGFTVDRHLLLGPRDLTYPELTGGQLDMMPEYIGSLLEKINKGAGEASSDPAATVAKLQERLTPDNLTVLGYTPAVDVNAYVVRPDTATKLNLTKMSDLAAVQDQLKWGLPPECKTNVLCSGSLTKDYGIDFDKIKVTELKPCSGAMATALTANGTGAIDIGELCSTQAAIAKFGLTTLIDDKKTQPADALAPVVRDDWLAGAGGKAAIAALLDPVSAKMTTEELTKLNVSLDIDQKDVAEVATAWLKAQGLLP